MRSHRAPFELHELKWTAVCSEIQISSRGFILHKKKKSYGFSNKVNFKKYPWQDAIWNANTKSVFSQSLNIKNDLNIYSGSLEDIKFIVILKLIGWDLSVRNGTFKN